MIYLIFDIDSKYMPRAVEWSTIQIRIPKEMVHVDKVSGRVSLLVDPLTKKGDIAKKGGEPSVILKTDPYIDEPQIVNPGQMINTFDAKERGKRYKGQIKEAKEAKKGVLDELRRDAGRVRTRAIVPLNTERSIVPVQSERAVVPVSRERGIVPLNTERSIVPVVAERAIIPLSADRAIVPLNTEREDAPPRGRRRGRRPRLQPVDVDDGGLDEFAAVLDSSSTHGTLRPIDAAIHGALSRLDSDLRVAGRRHTAFEELRRIGQRAVDEQTPAEDKVINRVVQNLDRDLAVSSRRHDAFRELRAMGERAVRSQTTDEELLAELQQATAKLKEILAAGDIEESKKKQAFDKLQKLAKKLKQKQVIAELKQLATRFKDSQGVEERKSPESHELLRQRQENRRNVAFEQLREIGREALQQTRQRERSQYNAQNYEQNRNAIRQHRNERIQCECGDEVMRTNMARHLKTQRHRNAMG